MLPLGTGDVSCVVADVPTATVCAPFTEIQTRYSLTPETAVHENVTGEFTFVALFAGAIVCGDVGLEGHPAVAPAAVKRKCPDETGAQPFDVATTHHSTGPAGTLPAYSLSAVTAMTLGDPLLNDAIN